jgi:CheY-like chemotaxis protein
MTKSRSHVFWWIDDEPKRIQLALVKKGIEHPRHAGLKGAGATLDVKIIAEGNLSALESDLAKISTAAQPDLIIIDQCLGNVERAEKLGSSLAVSLRAQRPTVPIVLVSADHPVLSQQRREGIDFIRVGDIQSGTRVPDLFAIAAGFKAVIKAKIQGGGIPKPKAVLKLLAVPKAEHDAFLHCLPHEFLQEWDAETPHRFARWVWNDLLGRNGFLVDELGVMTLLGLREEALPRVAKVLSPCLYSGCFASAGRPRWWVSLVRETVRTKFSADLSDPLSELGRRLVKGSALYSEAYAHEGEAVIPDCVAYIDGRMRERAAALRKDTQTLPFEIPAPGFDPVRVFTGVAK